VTAAARISGWFSGFGKAAAEVLPVRLGGQSLSQTLAKPPVRMAGFDQALLWVTVALLMFGLVMVYSASIAMPDNPKFARYAHTHFLVRHVLSLVVAFIVAVLAFQVPLATWEKLAPWLFVILAVAADTGPGAFHRQRRQWRPPLDIAGHHELSAFGAGQICGAALRGRLHGAQDGSEGALLPRRHAHGDCHCHCRPVAAG
jgi:hypothetical protein